MQKLNLSRIAAGAILLFAVGCAKTTIDVENTSGSEITVTVKTSNVKKTTTDKNGKKTTTEKAPSTFTIAAGASRSIPVGAPPLNKTADVAFQVSGEFVNVNESLTVNVGEANAKKITSNAGVLEVTNHRGKELKYLFVSNLTKTKSGAVAGLLGVGEDFGDNRGPVADGQTTRVGPLLAGDNYRIKIAKGPATTFGPYVVKAGEVTQVDLKDSAQAKPTP